MLHSAVLDQLPTIWHALLPSPLLLLLKLELCMLLCLVTALENDAKKQKP